MKHVIHLNNNVRTDLTDQNGLHVSHVFGAQFSFAVYAYMCSECMYLVTYYNTERKNFAVAAKRIAAAAYSM